MKRKPPIAVVGMSGLFPGALDLDMFWSNIINKVDSTCDIPKERWIVEPESVYSQEIVPQKISPDNACSKRGCLVKGFEFDPAGLNIPPDLAVELDPLYHMVLHTGRQALLDCDISSVDKKNTGVILATIALPTDTSSFITREILGASFEQHLFNETSQKDQDIRSISKNMCLAGRVTSLPGSILAKALSLGGGSYTLDAACASSIYAIKLACDELHAKRSDVMLAGGVSRPDCLYTQVGFSQLQALSPSGRCAPFDQSADGLVVGEGAGVLVLKRVDDALRDKDKIFGLIHGIGLSNDMGGNLLTPYKQGQIRALKNAYEKTRWSPDDIDLIECHGTGTPVGDREELSSIVDLWKDAKRKPGTCAIGSVKSMIGHLLTAAGVAGMIKTLLALNHRILPPSLNFNTPPENSPLSGSPFRVQTKAENWVTKKDSPLRAAVNAFGFGGINAHLLLEHADFEKNLSITVTEKVGIQEEKPPLKKSPDIAIVGMASVFGSLNSLNDFKEVVLKGDSIICQKPLPRWKGCENIADKYLGTPSIEGGFMDDVSALIGEFHIPPNEIKDMLPQHLLMLNVAKDAMKDAGLLIKPEKGVDEDRSRMGVIIGMGFDYEATNFSQRWNLSNDAAFWEKRFMLNLDPEQYSNWLESLKDSFGPPLTPSRTVGALGGIMASRIAKEFLFGGPSFVVSCEEASGIKALEIGVRSLQLNETDVFVVGAVDLPGDIRSIITTDKTRPYTKESDLSPFGSNANGTLPGEGAVALVLKPLDKAIKDKDRIYSVIKGIGKAGGGSIRLDSETDLEIKDTYQLSMDRAFDDAQVPPLSVSFVETHGSADPKEDDAESKALYEFFSKKAKSANTDSPINPVALGSVKANIGHTGAAAGLASIVKTSLCLFQEIIPPLRNFIIAGQDSALNDETFHIPAFSQYWIRDRKYGPRRACVSAITMDGNCAHVILEDFEYSIDSDLFTQVSTERKRPLGLKQSGLFVVESDSKEGLIKNLDALLQHVRHWADKHDNIELTAQSWLIKKRPALWKKHAVSVVSKDPAKLGKWIQEAKDAILSGTPKKISGPDGIKYSPEPVGRSGGIAFIFPGSGNHYVGMGREIGVLWPDILRQMDAETSRLKAQILPECYVPWRNSWEDGWEIDAHKKIVSDPHNMIFGQVTHGCVVANLVKSFNIKPSAVIGYSLGESTGLFAMGAWHERGRMLERMEQSNLFRTELAGPCNAARKVWKIPADQDVNWCVAAVNRSGDTVKKIIKKVPQAYLLIVNTPNECVIGGREKQVKAAINMLGCDAVFLEGVVTVHCDAAVPVKDAYKELHQFPIKLKDSIKFYSCARAKSYELSTKNAAASILNQALSGFDFTATINQAYKDGVRVFLEMGPHSSCTRMITQILDQKPHLAVSACARSEEEYLTILKFVGSLAAERVPCDLDRLYSRKLYDRKIAIIDNKQPSEKKIAIVIGGKAPNPLLPPGSLVQMPQAQAFELQEDTVVLNSFTRLGTEHSLPQKISDDITGDILDDSYEHKPGHKMEPRHLKTHPFAGLADPMSKTIEATSKAHDRFLDFSNNLTNAYAKTLDIQTRLLAKLQNTDIALPDYDKKPDIQEVNHKAPDVPPPAYSKGMCMEFAIGSAAKVLGPDFAALDSYKARVRLPDDPLMLVDRIMSVEGEKGCLGPGRIVTEHDVLEGAWYLDGGHAPVCISIEAGQADLFLCSYLGIDLAVKGERNYRLLDAVATFHTGLPKPGDTVRYEIQIEKFIHQGETYLFFFNFKGFIKDKHIISMCDGCAGFFTKDEVKNSGGIILTKEDTMPMKGKKDPDWEDLVSFDKKESYDDKAVEALRTGDIKDCFGPEFEGIFIAESIRLPAGKMKLIDRVLELDPKGGQYSLGIIKAQADVTPDAWFLTCHFVDDMVMPGTLMYECCQHTLRVFVQRMGWVSENEDVCYEPVCEVGSVLKCRGPVTPDTKKVVYEVTIKELGYNPEAYVIADAFIYVDGSCAVSFKNMSMKMSGMTKADLKILWDNKSQVQSSLVQDSPAKNSPAQRFFDRDKLLAFATGNPSDAFGERFKVFDNDRVVARLPGPPYLFIDKVYNIEPEPFKMKPGGWIEAQYQVPFDPWYFRANRTPFMAFCILNEIALQPCGFLAAYAGSSLRSEKVLKFRNLGGNATLFKEVQKNSTLTMRARMTKVSEASDIIIQHFDMQVLEDGKPVYQGDATFGFFTKENMENQVGIGNAKKSAYQPTPNELKTCQKHLFKDEDDAPLSPEDTNVVKTSSASMPSKALRMVDRIDAYIPDGGPLGLGFIRGSKKVDPDEWFFKAHFYQDPVCPGSLGLESFIQLIKFMALDRFKDLIDSHTIEHVKGKKHSWIYRGQVVPKNKLVEVEAVVTKISEGPEPSIWTDGYLKVDGLYIYQMNDFGITMVPKS